MKPPFTLNIDTVSGDWCDKDELILHACFKLLTDCIEQEQLLTGDTNWNYTEEFKAAKAEIEELYTWWNKRKHEDHGFSSQSEQVQYATDNEMLIRLIKVRKYLWT